MSKIHKKYLKKRLFELSGIKNISLFDGAGLTSEQFHIISLYACENKAKIFFVPTYMLEQKWNQSKNNQFVVLTTKILDENNFFEATKLIAGKIPCLGLCVNNIWYFGERAKIKDSAKILKKKLFFFLITYKNKLN